MTDNEKSTILTNVEALLAETKAFTLYRLKSKVLFFDYHDNVNIELSDVKLAFELYVQNSENCSCKVLLAFGQFSTIDVDARKHAEDKVMPTPAQAIVIRSLAQRMLARFYQLLRKDKHPLKFFKNPEEAFDWLITVDSNNQTGLNQELLN